MAPEPNGTLLSGTVDEGSRFDGESIVISGMAGLFPLSNHVKEFADNLYNKVNMVTDDVRYTYNHSEVQNYCGTVPGLERFDAQFFGVHYRLTMTMDPMAKKLLENTYQAIYDAGLNPETLRGKNIGVFTGTCFSEAEKAFFYVAAQRNGHGIVGCCKAMFANRISYWLDAKGPSMSIDSMCSSSVVALECAVNALRRGDCEAAVVGGANLCLHPQSSILYGRTIQMCADGKTKSFDKNADGLARSEAVNVIFLQKAKDAKRIYAEVCKVKSKFTPISGEKSGQHYGPHRPVGIIKDFFTECYEDLDVTPAQVEYVEAFGTGIADAEKNELEAIGEVFCKNRKKPLLIGSVMSNMGYSEAASGVSSIIKLCLGYHTGQLAGNLHYETPRDDVVALREGRMRVLTDHTPFSRQYTAINNFSISGTNAHVLLKGFWKKKDLNRYHSTLPYLVGVSGRQESGVKRILDDLKVRPVDPEEISLLHHIHERNILGHLARGYIILSTNEAQETVVLAEQNEYFADVKRPLWFVYSGMGSQWAGMGAELMRIPIFSAAIERCRKVLEPRGVDIVNILTDPDKHTFDNILNSFVGIAAVQIGLTDILTELGIEPDFIIGHSVGELGCAYADGCFTAEEMILSAYSRGLVSVQTPFIHGSMAAVGLGYKAIAQMCPPEIEVACHNGPDSSTISGPAEAMKEFVAHLTAHGVFAKEVPCSNIAYHSRYISEAGPRLRKFLSQVIKDPKQRSERWVSTSVPQDRWNEPVAKFSSAEYHTNNLLSPVLFEETARLIPQNAVVVEIAPHGLLQAILKRSLSENCSHIPLTRRGNKDPSTFLLNAIGKLYQLGFNPKIQAIYPQIEYPVSTGTPFLSHLVEWSHSEHWPLAIYAAANRLHAAERHFVMSIHDDEHKYIEGHVIEGKTVFPLSSVLVVVWETLAMVMREKQRHLCVQFHDVYCHREVIVHRDQPLRLCITIQRGSGRFEVTQNNFPVVSGLVNNIKYSLFAKLQAKKTNVKVDALELNSDDIYRILFNRGYGYKGEFRGIHKANLNLTKAEVAWNGNWVTLIDNMLQFNVLRRDNDGISKPKYIRRLTIDTKTHEQTLVRNADGDIDIYFDEQSKLTRSGGVIIEDVDFLDQSLLEQKSIVTKKQQFLSYFPTGRVDLATILHVHLHIIADNTNEDVINAMEILSNNKSILGDELKKTLKSMPVMNIKLEQGTNIPSDGTLNNINLIVGKNIITNDNICKRLQQSLSKDIFVISLEEGVKTDRRVKTSHTIVSSAQTPCGFIVLSRWYAIGKQYNTICVTVDEDLSFLKEVQEKLTSIDRLLVITKYPPRDGLKDLIRKWRKETENNKIHLIMTERQTILDEEFVQVAENQLATNVFVNNMAGDEIYLPAYGYKTNQNLRLRSSQAGDIDSLTWVEAPVPEATGIRVRVHYAGPSFMDVQRASGSIPYKNNEEAPAYGMDFSGTMESGQRVMGVIGQGALSAIVEADPELLWPVPDHWSLEDAATVPQPYAYAFYCLAIKCRALPGSRVLVHGGAGALGQAVISVALSLGLDVYSTVSDNRKKHFLKKLFPELSEEHIGNSRDGSFETMVKDGTKGSGCTFVINTLKGELKETSKKCVESGGFFIDVTSKDVCKNVLFGMEYLSHERSYVPTVFSTIFRLQDSVQKRLLQRMVSEGIASGFVRPLSRVVYQPDDVSRAFHLLAGCRHRGRSLVYLKELTSIKVQPSLSCTEKGSYVVVCDKNDFGIELADRLVKRGARNLTIHCDKTIQKGYLLKNIKAWKSVGVRVQVTSESLVDNNNSVELLNKSNAMGPVEGVFIVNGTNNSDEKIVLDIMDHASRKICSNLKYFAVIQPNVKSVEGHVKLIMAERTKKGLPSALLLLPNLTQYDDVQEVSNDDEKNKIFPLSTHEALNILENILQKNDGVVTSYAIEEDSYINVIDDISKILGLTVSMIENLPLNTTLEQIGADFDATERISKLLSEKLEIFLNKDALLQFTIAELKEFQDKVIKKSHRKDSRNPLNVFYTRVDPDELQATVDMVVMPTFIHNSTQRDDEFNSNETYLTIVPGFEGHYAMFQLLCERLKLPAVVLQPPLDRPHDTIEQLSQRFVKTMQKNMDLSGKKFYLLGYSVGVLVAMEMAAILEDLGFDGTVFCLDSAPGVFAQQLTHVLENMTDEELQNSIVQHMYSLMAGDGLDALKLELQISETWDNKVDACMRQLCGRVNISAQYARSLVEAGYARIKAARLYEGVKLRRLRSQIILLRANQQPSALVEAPNDFGLSQYSEIEPIVYQLDSNHGNAPQDLQCSNVINRHLEEYLLQRYHEKNLCETYLINAAKFMDSSVPNKAE